MYLSLELFLSFWILIYRRQHIFSISDTIISLEISCYSLCRPKKFTSMLWGKNVIIYSVFLIVAEQHFVNNRYCFFTHLFSTQSGKKMLYKGFTAWGTGSPDTTGNNYCKQLQCISNVSVPQNCFLKTSTVDLAACHSFFMVLSRFVISLSHFKVKIVFLSSRCLTQIISEPMRFNISYKVKYFPVYIDDN